MSTKASHTVSPGASFPLKFPFTTAAGERIEKITLRRGKRADLRMASKHSENEFEQETFLFARLAGLTMEDLDELDLVDNAEMVRRFRGLAGHDAQGSGDAASGGRVAADRAEDPAQ